MESKDIVGENRFHEVRYEDLVENPIAVFRRVVKFCELDWYEEFEEELRLAKLENRNYKWKKYLSPRQKELLNWSLRDVLVEMGYR